MERDAIFMFEIRLINEDGKGWYFIIIEEDGTETKGDYLHLHAALALRATKPIIANFKKKPIESKQVEIDLFDCPF